MHILTSGLNIPKGAQTLMQELINEGHTAWVVGGCVRDSILGRTPHDWDICTSATPDEMKWIFRHHRVIDTGIKHGTVTVLMNDNSYEVTTYRVDNQYSDHRHPDSVDFTKDVSQDLSRRDFTINAMAHSVVVANQHELLDLFGGMEDLQNGIIRTVGNPVDRFSEDSLRILRALRFASVYKFAIEPTTAQAIHVLKSNLSTVSSERTREELSKLLAGPDACRILEEFPDVICEIIPEMVACIGFDQHNPYHCYNVYDHICHAVGEYCGNSEVINMALLLHDIGKPKCYFYENGVGHFHGHGEVSADLAEKILDRLRFDNRSKEDIVQLIYYHDMRIELKPRAVRRMLGRLNRPELFESLMEIRHADIMAQSDHDRSTRLDKRASLLEIAHKIIEESQCFQMKDLAIDGRVIMSVFGDDGIQGKQIGQAKEFCLNGVIDEQVENNQDALIQYLKDHIDEWLN